MKRRRFILGSAFAGGAALLGYTIGIEPFWPEVTIVPIKMRGLPEHWKGRTICQISDLHVSHRMRMDYLSSALEDAANQNCDVVLYTGDFITFENGCFDDLETLLPSFPRGRLGTFGVLGNHDYGKGWRNVQWAERVAAILHGGGVRVLRNEVVENDGLRILGMEDLWSGRMDLNRTLGRVSPDKAAIMMCHNPDGADLAGWDRFSGLIVAGHTHGGQCKPPFLPPPLLPVKNRRYTSGLFELAPSRSMYINRGLGYLHQTRFNARPEITVFQLG